MRPTDLLKTNLSYAFIVVGLLWAVVGLSVGALVLWPVLALVLSGLLLRLRPNERYTWALSKAAALMGFLLAGYQAYVAVPWLSGVFGTVAATTLGAFALFSLVHLVLLGTGPSTKAKSA